MLAGYFTGFCFSCWIAFESGLTFLERYVDFFDLTPGLTFWINNDFNLTETGYLKIYSIFSLSYGFFASIRSIILYSGVFKNARNLHREMTLSLLYAPLNEFFERIPLGRIFNRLSSDMALMDLDMNFTIGQTILYGFLFTLDVI